MSIVENVYGLPVYLDKINPDLYPKHKLLSQIKKNYNISNIRNNWSNYSNIKTDIHHSILDEKNVNFKDINYYNLTEVYEKIIKTFFKKLSLKNGFDFNFKIDNYTCSRHNSFMAPHIHTDCSFSLIHYVSFDKKQHIPTIFKNPYFFNNLLPNGDMLRNVFNSSSGENSWLYKEWTFDTKEDDIVIVPSILEHYVRNLDCKKLRITIVSNIRIKEIKNEKNKV
mgnify:FL=1|jgi:hypothetical protein|tara:strand:- start:256 stop:927 length:672 start_codon:yes stop_codon:yes gene_type:complete